MVKPRDELLTLKDAMQLSRGDVRELYKHYANSGLATMMGLINLSGLWEYLFGMMKGMNTWTF